MLEINRIYQGDCVEIMKDIDDNSIDFINTDPPFNVGLKYESKIDDNLSSEQYYKWCKSWGVHLYRVLKPRHYAVVASSQINLMALQKAMIDSGFTFHHFLEWLKPNCQKVFTGTVLFNRIELLLVLSKGKPDIKLINRKVLYQDVLQYPNEVPVPGGDANHPARRPVALYKQIIAGFTKPGDLVLDCFLGSGTTAIACKELNRNYIGIELSEIYCKMAKDRTDSVPESLPFMEEQDERE